MKYLILLLSIFISVGTKAQNTYTITHYENIDVKTIVTKELSFIMDADNLTISIPEPYNKVYDIKLTDLMTDELSTAWLLYDNNKYVGFVKFYLHKNKKYIEVVIDTTIWFYLKDNMEEKTEDSKTYIKHPPILNE